MSYCRYSLFMSFNDHHDEPYMNSQGHQFYEVLRPISPCAVLAGGNPKVAWIPSAMVPSCCEISEWVWLQERMVPYLQASFRKCSRALPLR